MSSTQPDPQYPHAYPPVNPGKPPKRKRFGFLAASLFVVGGAIVGSMIGSASAGGAKTAEAPQATATVYTTKAPASKVSAPTVPAFTDGSYIVGTDVEPGRYKTIIPAEQQGGISLCFVTVKSGADFIVTETTNKGHTIVNIPNRKGAILKVQGCGGFTRV